MPNSSIVWSVPIVVVTAVIISVVVRYPNASTVFDLAPVTQRPVVHAQLEPEPPPVEPEPVPAAAPEIAAAPLVKVEAAQPTVLAMITKPSPKKGHKRR